MRRKPDTEEITFSFITFIPSTRTDQTNLWGWKSVPRQRQGRGRRELCGLRECSTLYWGGGHMVYTRSLMACWSLRSMSCPITTPSTDDGFGNLPPNVPSLRRFCATVYMLKCLPQHKVRKEASPSLRHMRSQGRQSKEYRKMAKRLQAATPFPANLPFTLGGHHTPSVLWTPVFRKHPLPALLLHPVLCQSLSQIHSSVCSHSCHLNIRPPPERVRYHQAKAIFLYLSTRRC